MTDQSPPTPATKRQQRKKSGTTEAEALRAKLEAAADLPGAARQALQDLRAAGQEAVAANQESLAGYDATLARIMDAIEKELDKPDQSPAERKELIDQMVEVARMRDSKDSENKRFLHGIAQDRMRAALYVAGGVGVIAVAAVAGPDGLKQLGKLAPQVAKKAITS